MNKSQIMKNAWGIRKSAAAKYGCPVSEINFSDCLKQAWKQYKTGGNMTEEKLTAIGGVKWEKYEKKRIYFNDLEEWFGLECSRYNTGNISSATLDGEKISNSRAKEISSSLGWAKLWYDLTSDEFNWSGICNTRDFNADEMADAIIQTIKETAKL
jgi:hypothetical protein